MKGYIITTENVNTGEWFYTTDHCQHLENDPNSTEWVSCAYGPLPGHCEPRKGLENGLITNKTDYELVFHEGIAPIANPNPNYQAQLRDIQATWTD